MLCAFFYGLEMSRSEKYSLVLTKALCDFVKFTGQHIENFRTPLPRIYGDYFDESLEREGFCEILCRKGLSEALLLIRNKIPVEVFSEMEKFSLSIGAGYEKGQADLCTYTAQRLENIIQERQEKLSSRLRMCRLLPLLLALSLVLLLF